MQMQESGQLVQAVTAACEVANLQAVPALVTKCLQLQDTMAVRFGVMLVGPAGLPAEPCNNTSCLLGIHSPSRGSAYEAYLMYYTYMLSTTGLLLHSVQCCLSMLLKPRDKMGKKLWASLSMAHNIATMWPGLE